MRAFRPGARRVLARVQGGESVMLEQRHPEGLFEGLVDGARLPLRYELEVSYPDDNVYTLRDPYAFCADAWGPRSTPRRGRAPRAARSAAGGPRARDRWCAGHLVRGVGAGRAGSERRG
ncbi:MAG: GlgB N-terminal domain-containing protein [Solirubrobacteraceae bacterium]